MNILLISPTFQKYNKLIIKCLKQSGKYQNIKYIEDSPIFSLNFYATLTAIFPMFKSKLREAYNNKIVENVLKNNIDIIFIIRGWFVDKSTIKKIKVANPNIRIVIYQWDSIKNNSNASNLVNELTDCYSFDPNDCKVEKRLSYLPLFYSVDNTEQNKDITRDIDVLFVGGFANYRVPLIRLVKKICLEENLIFECHLFIDFVKFVKHYSKLKFYKNDVTFYHIQYNKYIEYLHRSKVVLDINNPLQSGLTMRTIESLVNNCLLVTTNKHVKNETFYDENNILILPSEDFINKEELLKFIQHKYNSKNNSNLLSLNDWLCKMLLV